MGAAGRSRGRAWRWLSALALLAAALRRGVGEPKTAFLAAAPALRGQIPVGASISAAQRPAPQRSRVRMAGLLDDVGKGIMNAASEAVTGMSEEDRDKLMAKMMSGNMDFNDYLKMTLLMQNQGGVMGVMNSVNNIPGLKQTLGMGDTDVGEAEAKMAVYSKIIGAMTEEEREQPGYFLLGEGARARVVELAKKTEIDQGDVDEFFAQFGKMKKFFTRMGVGVREGKSNDQIAKEMEKEAAESEDGSMARPSGKPKPFINPNRKLKKAKRKGGPKRPPPPPIGSKASAALRKRNTFKG